MSEKEEVKDLEGRTETGQFMKGVSGNPAGRPKGSKNRTTLLRQAIEGDMVERLSTDAIDILEVAIELAKKGDQACIKILMDRLLPTRKAADEDTKSGVKGINIVVQNMSKESTTTIDGTTIEEEEYE